MRMSTVRLEIGPGTTGTGKRGQSPILEGCNGATGYAFGAVDSFPTTCAQMPGIVMSGAARTGDTALDKAAIKAIKIAA